MWWERTNVNFHPDFAHAFDLDIPDQTPFLFMKGNHGGFRYVWKGGKPVTQTDDAAAGGTDGANRAAEATQPSPN
jgi:hypothetical protein